MGCQWKSKNRRKWCVRRLGKEEDSGEHDETPCKLEADGYTPRGGALDMVGREVDDVAQE